MVSVVESELELVLCPRISAVPYHCNGQSAPEDQPSEAAIGGCCLSFRVKSKPLLKLKTLVPNLFFIL